MKAKQGREDMGASNQDAGAEAMQDDAVVCEVEDLRLALAALVRFHADALAVIRLKDAEIARLRGTA